MGEIISLIFTLVAPGLLIWLPVLLIIGYLLKHATSFPNEFIGVVLLISAVVISVLYGIGITDSNTAGRWSTVLIAYGIGQGFLLTFASVFVYDVIHGAAKYIKRKQESRKQKAQEVSNAAEA